ncbi:MAG TPA: ABC transporter ATP-binding protein [Alphaproteobacteria bacterium]|nr:ABC transporter ATP-binding protein [Alphaproteobacteria bacterium]
MALRDQIADAAAAAARPILSIHNLSIGYQFGKSVTPVIKDISLEIPKGRIVALVGESGSGKTTLTQSIIGLLPANAKLSSGRILFHDPVKVSPLPVDIASLRERSETLRALRGGRIGMVFQEPAAALSPVYTIGNLLAESLLAHENASKDEVRARSLDILARVGFGNPEQALSQYPFELSGGLRQRAMIAAALICKPALLIADEPTSALDVTVQALTLKLIADLQREMGLSVLLITHDLGVVATVADEVVVLYRGEIMESGSVIELLKDPQHPYLQALLKAGPSMSGLKEARLTPLRPIAPPSELFKGHWTRKHEAAPGAPLVELKSLVKRFVKSSRWGKSADTATGTLAVNHVSLTVRQGECLGLVGESGSGKSTLCRILMQIMQPDQGETWVFDQGALRDVATLDRAGRQRFRQRVQYVFQDPFGSLNPRHTIRTVLNEPFDIHTIGTRQERQEWAAELLEIVGLNRHMLDRYPNTFSGGQRQRIAIARALALKPDLLVCDEPVSALDVSVQAQILNLLQDLKDTFGLTYLFVSHDLGVIRHMADRVAVMCQGRLVEIAPARALFENPWHPYTKALMAAAPEQDPTRKLDLTALSDGRASDPACWDPPYQLLGDAKPRYEEVTPDHFVAIA